MIIVDTHRRTRLSPLEQRIPFDRYSNPMLNFASVIVWHTYKIWFSWSFSSPSTSSFSSRVIIGKTIKKTCLTRQSAFFSSISIIIFSGLIVTLDRVRTVDVSVVSNCPHMSSIDVDKKEKTLIVAISWRAVRLDGLVVRMTKRWRLGLFSRSRSRSHSLSPSSKERTTKSTDHMAVLLLVRSFALFLDYSSTFSNRIFSLSLAVLIQCERRKRKERGNLCVPSKERNLALVSISMRFSLSFLSLCSPYV